jgi:hypothetical protein
MLLVMPTPMTCPVVRNIYETAKRRIRSTRISLLQTKYYPGPPLLTPGGNGHIFRFDGPD